MRVRYLPARHVSADAHRARPDRLYYAPTCAAAANCVADIPVRSSLAFSFALPGHQVELCLEDRERQLVGVLWGHVPVPVLAVFRLIPQEAVVLSELPFVERHLCIKELLGPHRVLDQSHQITTSLGYAGQDTRERVYIGHGAVGARDTQPER